MPKTRAPRPPLPIFRSFSYLKSIRTVTDEKFKAYFFSYIRLRHAGAKLEHLRIQMSTHLCFAFVRLVDEDLGHPLDGDGEGDDGVVQRGVRGGGLLRGTALARATYMKEGLNKLS